MVVDAGQAHIVQDIFSRYLEFKSLTKVKKHLDAKCHKTQQGKEFSTMAIGNILKNRFYIGEVSQWIEFDFLIRTTHSHFGHEWDEAEPDDGGTKELIKKSNSIH